MWKRSHGRTSEAPPDERGGYRYVRPTATASHLDSTLLQSSADDAAYGNDALFLEKVGVQPIWNSCRRSRGSSACPAPVARGADPGRIKKGDHSWAWGGLPLSR